MRTSQSGGRAHQSRSWTRPARRAFVNWCERPRLSTSSFTPTFTFTFAFLTTNKKSQLSALSEMAKTSSKYIDGFWFWRTNVVLKSPRGAANVEARRIVCPARTTHPTIGQRRMKHLRPSLWLRDRLEEPTQRPAFPFPTLRAALSSDQSASPAPSLIRWTMAPKMSRPSTSRTKLFRRS